MILVAFMAVPLVLAFGVIFAVWKAKRSSLLYAPAPALRVRSASPYRVPGRAPRKGF